MLAMGTEVFITIDDDENLLDGVIYESSDISLIVQDVPGGTSVFFGG